MIDIAIEERTAHYPDWTRASTFWTLLEELLSLLIMLGLVALPILEGCGRFFGVSVVSGSQIFTQHLVLLLSMSGAALAARDDRMLSISLAKWCIGERYFEVARIFSYGVAAAITGWLIIASLRLVKLSALSGERLPYSIPIWTIQAALPLGFAAICLRLIYRGSTTWWGRLGVFLICCFLFSLPGLLHERGLFFKSVGYLLIGLAALAGAPIYAAIGGLTFLILIQAGGQTATVPLNYYNLATNPTLPAVPLFTFAGYIMAYSDASERLVRFFQSWFSWIRGGPAVVAVLACAFFTAFTGASGVTILALGGLLLPVLTRSGYDFRAALGLLTTAGSLGLLFPPCLPPILYSIVASVNPDTAVPIERLFVAGLVPGAILIFLVCCYSAIKASRIPHQRGLDISEALQALFAAKWELFTPVVTLGALFGGFATPVEAAAVTVAYVLLVQVIFRRGGKGRFLRLLNACTDCSGLVGGVLLILGVATAFTYILIDQQVPDLAVQWVTEHVKARWTFLLALNGLLLIVGCLMDIYSAIIVVAPIVIPMAHSFGIDPIHLGIIFLTNLELGYLTPPVGINLFLAAYRFRRPVFEIFRSVVPFLAIMAIGVLLVTYVPWLSMATVRLFFGS